MSKKLLKYFFCILLVVLDCTLAALLPATRSFFLSVSMLIFFLFNKDPLFFNLAIVVAILLGVWSVLPWFVYVALFLLWSLFFKKISTVLYVGRSVWSLIIFYAIGYGSFQLIFLSSRLINGWVIGLPYTWAEVGSEFHFLFIGLAGGLILTAVGYLGNEYFEKKFQSWFFIRRRSGY